MSIDHAALNTACFAEFGEAAVYTPSGGSAQNVTVIVEHNVDYAPGGIESGVIERRPVLHLLKSDVAVPGRGDTCVVGATTYIVEQLLDDDGYVVKAVAR